MIKTIKASPHNYGVKRNRNNVSFIVIHYTAGNGDTAEAEGKYFSRPHDPKTSAHFFIGQDGHIIKSVPLDHVAYSVGGSKYADCKQTGGGKYYGMCTNANSVSIEMCDNLKKDPSEKQKKAVKECIKYIKKYCKNAFIIVRHFDVTGKHCPARMMDNKKWNKFKSEII